MPTDVLELKQMMGGGPMGSIMNPELSKAEMGKEYDYGYGGMVKKKKKSKKKK